MFFSLVQGEFDDDDLTAAEAVLADEPKSKSPPTPAPTAIKRSAPITSESSEGLQVLSVAS